MSYPLLEKAPKDQNSPEFLDFLRANNKVIFDGSGWLVIENCKYHKEDAPWYTAFWKAPENGEWYFDIDILWHEFGEYEWLKKAHKEQAVPGRFHIHLIKKS